MRMHRWGLLLVVAAVGLAGCGGGGESLTKAEFIRRGNQLCERTESRIAQVASTRFQPGEIPSSEQITEFVNESLAPALEEELNGLEELGVPEGDEERVQDILDAGRTGVDEARRDPTGLIGERSPLEDYDELADGYGLDRCGGINDEVQRALTGLGPSGPVRGGGGDTGGGSGQGETEGAGGGGGDGDEVGGAPGDDQEEGDPGAQPTETTPDTATDDAG